VKVFHEQAFAAQGLKTDFAEEYYSVSHKNVIRGLHFQLPPMDHVKMVYCVAGEVMDAVVDLRTGSPTYGQCALFELNAAKANSIYIPKGMAHGFCARSDQAIMVYKVSTIYSPAHDAGVLWNSVGIPWPTTEAILSERDQSFPPLDKFASPFRYE
jgi:dTDP-4-dehydrorhamnose 3,5-epimerase